MASKLSQKAQHAAARRELEDQGVPEARIQELERGWNEHTANIGCVELPKPLETITVWWRQNFGDLEQAISLYKEFADAHDIKNGDRWTNLEWNRYFGLHCEFTIGHCISEIAKYPAR